MENQSPYIRIIVLLVGLSLVGLLIVQGSWLLDSLETNRSIFQQRINLASREATKILKADNDIPYSIHAKILNGNTENILSELTSIIDNSLENNDIHVDYTYGLYRHATNHYFTRVAGSAEKQQLTNQECNESSSLYFAWTNFTCNMNLEDGNAYHLAIFPSYNSYIFNEVKWSLFLSLICITIILLGFLYTLRTIGRQRKLSLLKNDFINNLTHEFKTPLFSINIASKSVRKSIAKKESNKINSYLDVIDTETSHLKNQVEKILQLAMLDAGRFHLEKSKIDLNDELQKVANKLQHRVQETGGELKLNLSEEPLIIMGDPLHLRNVWYNLIDNSLKYTERIPRVEITTSKQGENIAKIIFSDNGFGILNENKDLIFKKFYRESKGNLYFKKGTGLGLSYVQKILELHNASISLEKTNTEGSQFLIKFPILNS